MPTTPASSAIALVNISLAGLWLGLLFVRGLVSLTAAWLAHYAWNLGLALLDCPSPASRCMPIRWGLASPGAPDLLTGGAFGVEASLVTTLAFAALCAWLLRLLHREQARL